jgi:hypothetical protein
MLLSEQVRQVAEEEILSTGATALDTATGWKNRKTVNVTITATKIVYVWMKTDTGGDDGIGRALLDGVPLVSTGFFSSVIEREVFVVLPAGSYVVEFQTARISGTGSGIRLQDTKVALLNFSDKQRDHPTGTAVVPAATESTILDQNFTPPATRKLAVGSIKKYVCIITVYTMTTSYAIDVMKNPGESNTANWTNWKIFLDDVQVSWTERNSDKLVSDHNAPGGYGRYVIALDPNVAYNLKIKAYNGSGSDRTCTVYTDIISCPWLLSDVYYEPVSLDFSQGSTVYAILEPLGINPTKYACIGKGRFMSFGDATDYYKSVTGTGILSLDYTFEVVDVTNSILNVKGFGGCISVIGVDVR